MKNFYTFLKLNGHIKSVRLKHSGIFLLYILKKRYIVGIPGSGLCM